MKGLGAFDIATLQYLYGPNTTKSTGDTTYYLDTSTLNGYQTIWDNGGTDTISAANSGAAVYIDSRECNTLEDKPEAAAIYQELTMNTSDTPSPTTLQALQPLKTLLVLLKMIV